MSYQRIPEDFLKNTFVVPHVFNDPENQSHGIFVNDQLKNDLYYSTLHEISNIEFKIFNLGQEEWIKVEKIKDCVGQMPWFSKYSNTFKVKKGRTLHESDRRKVQLLSCQDWQVSYHNNNKKSISNYRVHILQSDNDIFKSQVYAPSIFKTLKDLLLN